MKSNRRPLYVSLHCWRGFTSRTGTWHDHIKPFARTFCGRFSRGRKDDFSPWVSACLGLSACPSG